MCFTLFLSFQVTFVMASLDKAGVNAPSYVDAMASDVGKKHLRNPAHILDYYSPTLINSAEAKQAFVLPDVKPLPNLI